MSFLICRYFPTFPTVPFLCYLPDAALTFYHHSITELSGVIIQIHSASRQEIDCILVMFIFHSLRNSWTCYCGAISDYLIMILVYCDHCRVRVQHSGQSTKFNHLKVVGSSPAVANVLCPQSRHFTSIVSFSTQRTKWEVAWSEYMAASEMPVFRKFPEFRIFFSDASVQKVQAKVHFQEICNHFRIF